MGALHRAGRFIPVEGASLALERLEDRVLLAVYIPTAFDADIDLNTGADTGPDGVVRIFGDDADDYSGVSVSWAGNVNGDCYDDFLIGADRADPAGRSSAGETYLVLGRSTRDWADVDLDTGVGTGPAGVWRIFGDDLGDESGWSVSSAGDVDADGYDDFLIGACRADPGGRMDGGEVYLIFGRSTGAWTDVDLDTGTGTGPPGVVRIVGDNSNDLVGHAVSAAGDVDADGYDDFLIGAYGANPAGRGNAGETYLVLGRATNDWSDIDLNTGTGTGPAGVVRIFGDDLGDESGWSVSSAGDVDADGYDDFLIGAPSADPAGGIGAGETYLVFGRATNDWSDIDLNTGTGTGPTDVVRIWGDDADDASGLSVSSAGDVDADGYDDLLIGAPYADLPGLSEAGETYIVFGRARAGWSDINLDTGTGTGPGNVVRVFGDDGWDYSGVSVSSAGDANADGYDDILIGADDADPMGGSGAGETYLVFGRLRADWADVDLDTGTGTGPDGVLRILGDDTNDHSGHSVSSAGDVNLDGCADILIGAYFGDPADWSEAGETYLVFGRGGSEIRGIKWHDLNGDGVQDPGEPTLAGRTVYLDTNDNGQPDPCEQTALTAADGSYRFGGIPSGDYIVREVHQSDWLQTAPGRVIYDDFDDGDFSGWTVWHPGLTGAEMTTPDIVVSPEGYALRGVGSGYTGQAEVLGHVLAAESAAQVRIDMRARSGPQGPNGVFLRLYDGEGYYEVNDYGQAITDAQWRSDMGGTIDEYLHDIGTEAYEWHTFSWIRDADGWWSLAIDGTVVAGDFARDAQLDSFDIVGIQTLRDQSELEWLQVSAGGSAPGGHRVSLDPGETFAAAHFGNARYGSMSGQKFEDSDGDGTRDAGEPGLAGWAIYPDLDDDDVHDDNELWTGTAADGSYSLDGLPPGSYVLREVQQPDWEQTYPLSPDEHTVTLLSGQSQAGIDFGNRERTEIHGVKWNDLDEDGQKDSGEPGLPGWLIYLDLDHDNTYDAGQEDSAVTGADGSYAITRLSPGTYEVREVQQAGWAQTYPFSPDEHIVTLATGQIVGGVDFGNLEWIDAIRGVKWDDLDGDGQRDAGEPGLPGWTIYLDLDHDNTYDAGQEDSCVTGADGSYAFTDLAPGTYDVREVLLPGWEQTYPLSPDEHTVTLTTGQVVAAVDFGNWRPAEIRGVKWNDLDGDGQKDAGEPGLPGWTIYLDLDHDNTYDPGEEDSYVTDADGSYAFTDLAAGTYEVREILQAGWTQTHPHSPDEHAVTLSAGQIEAGIDFGNWQPAEIRGLKWNDVDGDGQKDAGEPVLPGWTIYLDLDHDNTYDAGQEDSCVTAPDGSYAIAGLAPGTYEVREVPQAGWAQTHPHSPDEHTLMLVSGQIAQGIDFGNSQPAEIRGLKWNDVDGDGQKDPGEPGLSGWTIYVDLDHDNVYDAGQEDSFVTMADGSYAFTDLAPGTYEVREVPQAGWAQTHPLSPDEHIVTLVPAQIEEGIDFGNRQAGAAISGVKWNDLDGDGQQDPGEPGLYGWTIYLDLDHDNVYDAGVEDSFVTMAGGSYAFTGLAPGTYEVREVLRAGWEQTFPLSPDEHTMTLAADQVEQGIDFGNRQPGAAIRGVKWSDLDGDGQRDAGEPGLSGWTIYLDLDHDDAYDMGLEDASITAADGSYAITGLAPGTYEVREVQQTGWAQTHPLSPDEHTVTLTAGQLADGIDFGNSQAAEIRGAKWNDLDGDGQRDAGEPGLSGWTIYLDLDHDNAYDAGQEDSSVTAADGSYAITGLAPGAYEVREVQQTGWAQTHPLSPDEHTVTLTAGQVAAAIDFGNSQPAEIRGVKWSDLDGDGQRDLGEPGLPGWTIYVDLDHDNTYDAGQELSSVTAADGSYTITGLAPGAYQVREVQQTGWTQTHPLSPDEHTVTLALAQVADGIDFGNSQAAEIRGVKWNDVDGDGQKDAGEPGLAGWIIYLDLDHDNAYDAGQDDSCVTAADGSYAFTGLEPGTYEVREVEQAGWAQTYPRLPDEHTVTLLAGEIESGVDFGNSQPAEIRGAKWNDLDGDGQKDAGEPPLAGCTVFLDEDEDGILDPGEVSAVTGPDGSYAFDELVSGWYTVREELPEVAGQVYPPPSAWQQAYPQGDGAHHVWLEPLEQATGLDFGNWQLCTVAGGKFLDADKDAFRDAGEDELAGWRVYADLNEDGSWQAGEPFAETDAEGQYAIVGLEPGSYTIREQEQQGWTQTLPGSPGYAYDVALSSGDIVAGLDFGNWSSLAPVREWTRDGTVVALYDVDGGNDVHGDDVSVVWGPLGAVSAVVLGGTRSMQGLGLVVSGAPSVGSIVDARRGTAGDIAFVAADCTVNAVTLKSDVSGYDLAGKTVNGIAFPAGAGPVAVYVDGNLGSITIMNGGLQGKVDVEGDLARGFIYGGSATGGLDVAGKLSSLTVYNGAVAGDLTVGGDLLSLLVYNGDLDGAVTVGGGAQRVTIYNGGLGAGGLAVQGGGLTSFMAYGGDVAGAVDVHGDVGTFTVYKGGLYGSLNVTGDLRSLLVNRPLPDGALVTANVTVQGDLNVFTVYNGDLDGAVTIGGSAGSVMVYNGGLGVGGLAVQGGALRSFMAYGGGVTGAVDVAGTVSSFTVYGGALAGALNVTGDLRSLLVYRLVADGPAVSGDVTVQGNVNAFTVYNGALEGDLDVGGNVASLVAYEIGTGGGPLVAGDVTIAGDLGTMMVYGGGLTGPVDVAGVARALTVYNGSLTGGLSVVDNLTILTVVNGDLAGGINVGGNLTRLAVSGGNVVAGAIDVGGLLADLTVTGDRLSTGNLLSTNVSAHELRRVTVLGRISSEGLPGLQIAAELGSFHVRDNTWAGQIGPLGVEEHDFDGVLACIV